MTSAMASSTAAAAEVAARLQAQAAVEKAQQTQVQSLHTEESMSISGNSARQMVMQKLQRKVEVCASLMRELECPTKVALYAWGVGWKCCLGSSACVLHVGTFRT